MESISIFTLKFLGKPELAFVFFRNRKLTGKSKPTSDLTRLLLYINLFSPET